MDNVVHFEIPADDMARAKKFYSSVFGWKTEDVPGMEYSMASTVEVGPDRMPKVPGAINGGMMKRMPAIKAPVITISVADWDTAVAKAIKAGGKLVMQKQKVMDMGYNGYIQDTEGNVIGIWQNIKK